MNPAQMLRQIRKVLQEAVWPDGSASVVVGRGVYATAGFDPEDVPPRFPFVMLSLGSPTPDKDDPSLIDQEFIIEPVVGVEGDEFGENALIGGPRANAGKSAGRGLAEIESPLLGAVTLLLGADGTPIVLRYSGAPQVSALPDDRHILHRAHVVRCLCTVAPEYEPIRNLVVAQGAAGHATATWKNPSARFDYRRTILVRKAGATAPASVTDGTQVYLGTLETFDDACGAGTFSWQAFAAYTFTGEASDQNYSPAGEVGASRTKAIT